MPSLVFAMEHNNYVKRNGDEVNDFTVHYFDPSEFKNEPVYKGFELLNKTSSLDSSSFPVLPGLYDMVSRPQMRRGVSLSSLKSVKFIREVKILPKDDCLIIWGCKLVLDYKPKNSSQVMNGVKLFGIDPLGSDDSNLRGFPIFSFFLDGYTLQDFPQLPAYYQISFSERRGNNGQALLQVDDLKLIEVYKPFDNSNKEGN